LARGRSSHAFAAQVRAILNTPDELGDQLGEVTVPALVVVGNQDILTPRGDSEEIAERLPNAELVVISGAAHGLMVEHASTFNRVLIAFLRRVSAAEAAAAAARPTGDAIAV
jgi:3-oxoadipate enol-lactonase